MDKLPTSLNKKKSDIGYIANPSFSSTLSSNWGNVCDSWVTNNTFLFRFDAKKIVLFQLLFWKKKCPWKLDTWQKQVFLVKML